MAPLINSNPTVCSKSRAGKEPRKHQSSSYLLAFCWKGIQQFTLCLGEWYQLTVDSPHIWPVMRKVFHVTPSDFLLFMGFVRSSLWHKRHGVSNHRQLYDLFNSLFKPTTKNTSKLSIISLCVCVYPVMEKAWSMPWRHYCPACRTSLIATRFWVVVICPIIKCLTVLEFSFIFFDLCLFIIIFNLIWIMYLL